MALRSVLYAALLVGANTALADTAALEGLTIGDMNRLVVHSAPKPVSDASFSDREGGSHVLADWQGKVVLVNFWATWCAPCREEMPALDTISREMGDEDFAVVPIATGRNRQIAIDKFFAEIEVDSLSVLLDPKQTLARSVGVFGLPVTLILDRDGNEIARLTGGAEWASDDARTLLAAAIGDPGAK